MVIDSMNAHNVEINNSIDPNAHISRVHKSTLPEGSTSTNDEVKFENIQK